VCGYRGHTKDQCFKVKGYPVVWRSKKKGANSGSYANNVDVAQSAGMKASTSHNNIEATNMIPSSPAAFFTQDQYNQILQMLSKGNDNGGEHATKAAAE